MIGFIARWLLRGLLLVLVIWAVAFMLVAFALNTESGTRWVIARADKALPGTLNLGEFDGTIWQGMRIASLTYVDANQRLEIQELAFDLDWPTIITRRLAVDNLAAKSVIRESLSARPDEPQPLQVEMQALPVPVRVGTTEIGRLELANSDQVQRFDDIQVRSLRIDGRRFEADRVRGRRETIRATVDDFSIRLAGDVPAEGKVRWQLLESEWSGEGFVEGSLDELAFEQQVAGPYPASATGVMYLLNRLEPEFDVQITWDRWTIGERPFVDGRADLRGSFKEINAAYRTAFINDGVQYELVGDATGNLDALSSFSANIANDLVDLELKGSLDLRPEFSARAVAVADHLDLQLLNAELDGQLSARADLVVDASGTLSASDLVATGELNDTAVRGRGDVLFAAERWECSNCVLNVAENQVSLNGQRNADKLTLAATVDAPALDQLWPGLVGAATGEVTINGDRGDIAINWEFENTSVTATADIQYSDREIAGSVRTATVANADAGSWELQAPFALRIAEQGVSLSSSEWLGELGAVQVSRLEVKGDSLQVAANIRDVPLQVGNQFLPANYQLSGTATAGIDLQRLAGRWSGELSWIQSDTVLRVVEINGDVTDVNVRQAQVDAELRDNALVANGIIEIEPGITGAVALSLEDLVPDAQMTGRLQLSGADWGWISAVVPQIDRFQGGISADITARGSLQAPAFSGTANWVDGAVSIPSLNVKLKDAGVTVTGASDGNATVKGSARSGSGELQITGRLEDLMLPERRASLVITGKGAELVNWPEYRVWGSPDITLTGNRDDWQISGQLEVPRADISPREAPVSAVKVSPDVVVQGEEATVVKETRITGETRLVLGDNVKFSALGLEARLRGNILFKQVEGKPISAEGRLSLVEGTYATQGQKLNIEQGELVFTGPLDDPLVDVRAVRVIEEFDGTVKAGIRLRGRAQNLTTTVYSEPAMSDADALSYLVLGRSLSQASDTDGNQLSGAAVALGLRQVTRITDEIGQSIGIDELSLTGDGGETTALVAGKQVNSRLYARYAYGVFSQLGSLLLRYRLNRNLVLEAGAGENQSLDILYTVEK